MVGRKNGGANGWANFRIHGVAMGEALQTPVRQFVAKKNEIFEFRNLIEI